MKKRFNVLFPIMCILLLALLVASPLVFISSAPAHPNEVMLAQADMALPAASESIMTQTLVGNPDIPRTAAVAVLFTISVVGLILITRVIIRRHNLTRDMNAPANSISYTRPDVSGNLNCPLFGAT